jgi:hypothetical protein
MATSSRRRPKATRKPITMAVVRTQPTPGRLAAIEVMKDRLLELLLPDILASLRDPEAA